jgi:type III pantothenate kinase
VTSSPLDLILDVGNTRTKAGLYRNGRLWAHTHLEHGDGSGLQAFLAGTRPHRIALASVAHLRAWSPDELARLAPVFSITGETPAPLTNAYATPETLGADRLANAVGAVRMFPGRAVLAIDLGTCITYDLVDASGVLRGGAISPGLRMRIRAMHAYSARLPLVEPAEGPALVGDTTEASLISGAHHGIVFELQGAIAAHTREHGDLAVVLTGGDALRSARALKSGIFAHPFLTLNGLHAILEYNRPALAGDADRRRSQGGGTGAAG